MKFRVPAAFVVLLLLCSHPAKADTNAKSRFTSEIAASGLERYVVAGNSVVDFLTDLLLPKKPASNLSNSAEYMWTNYVINVRAGMIKGTIDLPTLGSDTLQTLLNDLNRALDLEARNRSLIYSDPGATRQSLRMFIGFLYTIERAKHFSVYNSSGFDVLIHSITDKIPYPLSGDTVEVPHDFTRFVWDFFWAKESGFSLYTIQQGVQELNLQRMSEVDLNKRSALEFGALSYGLFGIRHHSKSDIQDAFEDAQSPMIGFSLANMSFQVASNEGWKDMRNQSLPLLMETAKEAGFPSVATFAQNEMLSEVLRTKSAGLFLSQGVSQFCSNLKELISIAIGYLLITFPTGKLLSLISLLILSVNGVQKVPPKDRTSSPPVKGGLIARIKWISALALRPLTASYCFLKSGLTEFFATYGSSSISISSKIAASTLIFGITLVLSAFKNDAIMSIAQFWRGF